MLPLSRIAVGMPDLSQSVLLWVSVPEMILWRFIEGWCTEGCFIEDWFILRWLKPLRHKGDVSWQLRQKHVQVTLREHTVGRIEPKCIQAPTSPTCVLSFPRISP